MSDEKPEPLDPAVRDLLDRASDPEPAPAGAKEEVWSHLESSVLGEPPGDGGADGGSEAGGDASSGSTGEPGTSADPGVDPTGVSEAASVAESAGSEGFVQGFGHLLGGANAVQTAVAFVLGPGVGAGGYAVVDSATSRQPEREPAAVVADAGGDTGIPADTGADARDTGGTDTDASTEDTAQAKVDTAPDSQQPSSEESPGKPEDDSAATEKPSTLASERLLLSRAQAALARGRAKAALEALAKHAEQFPSGALTEERLALEVRALQTDGRADDARRKAEAFMTAYPKSIFTDVVKPALQADRPDAGGR